MVRILHISDLHFCADRVRRQLQGLTRQVHDRLGLDIDIHVANQTAVDALSTFVQQEDPDVLVVSGDVTAFGDRESFDEATAWIEPLLTRPGGRGRRCLVVPGNHDVLMPQLLNLVGKLNKLPFAPRLGLKSWLRSLLVTISRLAPHPQPSEPDLFHNFREFIERGKVKSYNAISVPIDSRSSIVLLPFCSVSVDPLWMNLGTFRQTEIERLAAMLRSEECAGEGKLRILILHHNPIASSRKVEPPLINAYNSMPGGSQLLRMLQQSGVDLVLHGHQHIDEHLLFDFDLLDSGHAFALGAKSATEVPGASCNVIAVADVNHATVTSFDYRPEFGAFRMAEQTTLCFERHRPLDHVTISARHELKRYFAGDDEDADAPLWEEVQKPGAGLIYISGRRLQTVTEARLRPIREILTASPDTYLRILLGNPYLAGFLSRSLAAAGEEELWGNDNARPHSGRPLNGVNFWGRHEALADVAANSNRTLESLREFVESLDRSEQKRLDIRLTHTMLPFAATIWAPDQPWGRMVVRLLPVGAVGDLAMPVFKLNRRTGLALYAHYLRHMKYLLGRGRPILGSWDRGDEDLSMEDLYPPNPSRRMSGSVGA